MNKINTILKQSIFLLLLISGFILMRNFISIQESVSKTINLAQYETSQQELQELSKERNYLEEQYQKLNTELYDLWYEVLESNDSHQVDLLDTLEKSKQLAGITDVMGDGLVVTINDKEGYNPLEDHVASLVHDQNIIYLLELLVNNGAQALSVNDLRIVNSSKVFCVGTTILCNDQRMTPPYIIKAIGPQAQMLEALNEDLLYSQLQADPYLIRFKVKASNDILIKGYATPATIDKDIEYLNNVPIEAMQSDLID